MAEEVQVNFGRPMPIFPIPGAVLLPHAVLPLHIFEPRYIQMVNHCLDGAGQIAMGTYEKAAHDDDQEPSVRPIVCIGQIIEHAGTNTGGHNILIQGVCRAQIKRLNEPKEERLYRTASLTPLEPVDEDPPAMAGVRDDLRTMLERDHLQRMNSVTTVIEWFDRDDVSTHALLELIGFVLLRDNELKYKLLAESCPFQRAGIIKRELVILDDLISRALEQVHDDLPKGMSWN